MQQVFIKILITLVSVIVLAVIGLFAAFITAFSGGSLFYSPLVLVCTGGLIVFVILKVFHLLKPKLFNILFLSFLVLCALSAGVYEAGLAYRNSFVQVNDQGVDLTLYQPFSENTKAVKLEEACTLQLTDDLPRLDGATALYPLYAAFAQAVYPPGEYDLYAMKEGSSSPGEVVCTTTADAYTRLINGETDIVFAARPSQQQLEEAKSKGLTLKLTPIGKEAFVFFVNARNGVSNLTTAQIQDIYAGNITNWKEVGGNNEAIRAFQRPENSGSQTMLQKLMEDKHLMTPPKENIASGMGDIIHQTASYRNYRNAIGYSFLFFATEMIKNNEIKLLEVDGVKPEKSTISSGAYPLSADFYAVTAGSDNPNIARFIEWILSPQGQYLVEKTGYASIGQ